MSVNGNEEPRWRELSPIQFSCNCNYSLITHNKIPIHSTWGLLSVYAACLSPRLNLSSELRPSWEQHPRYVPHRVRNRYNNTFMLEISTERRHLENLGADGVTVMKRVTRITLEGVAYRDLTQGTDCGKHLM